MPHARAIALAFAGYLAFAVVLTWPLGAAITTDLPHVAGTFVSDLYYVVWALAWQTHALVTDPLHVANANVYGGVPLALLYGSPAFGLLPLFAPVFLVTGNPTLAMNATLLVELALTATALHVVTRTWTDSTLSGVAAATTFLASNGALVMCAIMPQYAALAPLPVIVWLLARPKFAAGETLVLAALVALQGLADVVYVGGPLVATLVLAAAVMLGRPRTRPKAVRVLLATAGGVLALAPIYAGYAAVRAANPDLRNQSIWRASFFDAIDLRTGLPLGYSPLAMDPMALAPAVIGLALLGVGLVGSSAPRTRAWWHCSFWFGTSWMIAWVVPLQFPSIRELVLSTVVRDFLRLALPALIAFSLLTGLGFAVCVDAARRFVRGPLRPAVAPALLALIVAGRIGHAQHLPGDYPTDRAPAPGPESEILRSGSGPVLVLPFGDPRKDSGSHATAMYRSIWHWRPLLNGYGSYQPSGFRERMDLARRLPDANVLDTLRRDTHLTSIVVYAVGLPQLTTGRWRTTIESGTLPGVRIGHDDEQVLVLSVDSQGW